MATALRDRFIKLNGPNNWTVWKFSILIALDSRDLKECVDGNAVPPEEPVRGEGAQEITEAMYEQEIIRYKKELKTFRRKDLAARDLIVTRMEQGPLTHILSCETALQMWDRLSAIYEVKGDVSVANLQKKYFNYRMKDSESIATYVTGLELEKS